MTATAQSVALRSIAQMIADGLPVTVEEVVLTGSVSRGVADDVSDIEMLIVTRDELELEECFALAGACGVTSLGTWGQQGEPTKRVSGYCEGVPVELVWWSRAHAEAAVDAIFAGDVSGSADAIGNGVGLRTSGLLAQWQKRLGHYPDELAGARIEDAALMWGGFAAAGLLTLIRPGERIALLERMIDDAARVVQIVFALNRVWPPTLKRLADRVAPLPHKPERLVERIEEALTERDPLRAVLVMTELQAETVALAPDGPNIIRAREWLDDARVILAQHTHLDVGAEERLSFAGAVFLLKASAETTAGAFAIIEEVDPLDTPLHVHANEDELFYVIEGEHVFRVGDDEFSAGPGAVVFAPRREPHAHRRVVPRTGRFLTIVSPAGFEGFFRELSAAESAGGAGPEAYERASEKYGITWLT